MSDDKVMLKIQMEKDLRSRVEAASEREGVTMSAWVRRVLLQSLPPVVTQGPALPSGADAMDAAFEVLEQRTGETDYPGVMPLPPSPQVAAPLAEKVQPAPSATTPPKAPMAPAAGHSCANFLEARGAGFAAGAQGTCMAQGNRVCHWASHTAKECPAFKARWARIPPMAPMR